jgi:ribosomal-protein-alanine N-acetyltransferase
LAGQISNNIRRLRFDTGEMSQKRLAEKVGVTRQTILAIEKNKYSPSLEVAFKIANVFKVPLEKVFKYTAEHGEDCDAIEIIQISTQRLILKKLEQHDKQWLVPQIGDWQVAQWLSNVPYPYTQKDADDFLQMLSQQQLNLSIFNNKTLIGGVGLTSENQSDFELGFWLAKQYWGQGYATEAAQGLLQYATEQMGLNRIKSSYIRGNDQSAKVLKKLGFKEVGESQIYCRPRREIVSRVDLILE